jgi:catechol 2,3-dioxygenase
LTVIWQEARDSRIGSVHLRVSNLKRALGFYRDILGFELIDIHGGDARLAAAANRPPQLILSEFGSSRPRPAGTTGLFHVAFRHTNRKDLARALLHLHKTNYPLQGSADHGVSEALYLADPDGNGIELYVDRPAKDWLVVNGQVAMTTEPLDIDDLLNELHTGERMDDTVPPPTHIGHIHLQISDLMRSERFYHEILGFEVTQRSFPGALFLSLDGYHHHIGLNTWAGRRAPAPPGDSLGLDSFSILFSDQRAIERITRQNLWNVDRNYDSSGNGNERLAVRDPDGITIVLGVMPPRLSDIGSSSG